MLKKIWTLLVVTLVALGFVAVDSISASADDTSTPPSGSTTIDPTTGVGLITPGDTPNDDGFYSSDDPFKAKFYVWQHLSKGGHVYDTSTLATVSYPIAILANDYLGTKKPQVVGFGKPSLGKVEQTSSGVYYTPTAAGQDSFTYTVLDVNGGSHTSTIQTNNVGLDPLVVTPIVGGIKVYNPNQDFVIVAFGHGPSAHPTKGATAAYIYRTILGGATLTYKPTAHTMKSVYKDSGRIEYGLTLPTGQDTGIIWYTAKLVNPYAGAHPAKSAYKKLSSSAFKVTLNNRKSTRTVAYYATYKKAGATKYTTKKISVKAHKTKVLKVTKLAKHSKIVVKAKIAAGSGAGSYKKLVSKRL